MSFLLFPHSAFASQHQCPFATTSLLGVHRIRGKKDVSMWPFKRTMNFNTWQIVRSKPLGRTYGRSISLFINNWQCHLATVDVYQDGSIDCWGFVDRALFQGKLQSRWVVAAPKSDQRLSVFNFGFTGVAEGHWKQTAQSIASEVNSILQALHPTKDGLLDMQGSDTEVRGKIRYAKLGFSDKKPYRQSNAEGDDILGDSVPILRVMAGAFELTRLVVYADGFCQVGSEEKLVPLDQVPSLYDDGRICNVAPAGSKIILPGLGNFRTTNDFGGVSVHDRMGEVYDKLEVLNGKPGAVELCAELFERYQAQPSAQSKEALRKSYEAVPEHLRCYCGDMDTKDTAIRAVLFGRDAESDTVPPSRDE